MKLERGQYYSFTNLQGTSSVIWITSVKKDKIIASQWFSSHRCTEAIDCGRLAAQGTLWEMDAKLISEEKAKALIDLWKPYDENKETT